MPIFIHPTIPSIYLYIFYTRTNKICKNKSTKSPPPPPPAASPFTTTST